MSAFPHFQCQISHVTITSVNIENYMNCLDVWQNVSNSLQN